MAGSPSGGGAAPPFGRLPASTGSVGTQGSGSVAGERNGQSGNRGGPSGGAGSAPPAGEAKEPPRGENKDKPQESVEQKPDCPPETPEDAIVLVFDGSVSMGLPLDMPLDVEADLDHRMDQGDEAARAEYRRWLAVDQPKRLGSGKALVRRVLEQADPHLGVGAVAFTDCRELRTQAIRPFAERDGIAAFIAGVTPRRGGDTALVESIQAAVAMLTGATPGKRGRILALTDGQETCGDDVCVLGAMLSQDWPDIRVDVMDLSGRSNAKCLADATGGAVVNYADLHDLGAFGELMVKTANACVAARPQNQ